jgi:hypothetical protein
MLDNAQTTAAMQADIDTLRERFPRTADLYREACAVMFFRYGQTPTTNSLYQLVRKGSMSVPSEALRQFWSDLRERARVDLQHADLPDQVKQSAGRLGSGRSGRWPARRLRSRSRRCGKAQQLSATQHWPRKLAWKTKLPNLQSSSRMLVPELHRQRRQLQNSVKNSAPAPQPRGKRIYAWPRHARTSRGCSTR